MSRCTGNDKDHMAWRTAGSDKDHPRSGKGKVHVHMISPVITGNLKGHMMCLFQDCRRIAVG